MLPHKAVFEDILKPTSHGFLNFKNVVSKNCILSLRFLSITFYLKTFYKSHISDVLCYIIHEVVQYVFYRNLTYKYKYLKVIV